MFRAEFEAGGPVMWWGDVAPDQRPTDAFSLTFEGHLMDSELDSTVRGRQGPYASSEFLVGNQLVGAPRYGLAVRSDVSRPLGGGRLGYLTLLLMARDGNYSSLSNEPVSKSSSYAQGDMVLGVRSGPWDIALFAKNFWDERAYLKQQGAYGSDRVGFGWVIHPRRVGISVRYRF